MKSKHRDKQTQNTNLHRQPLCKMDRQRAQLQTYRASTTVAVRKSFPLQKNTVPLSARREKLRNAVLHTKRLKRKELRRWKKEKGSERLWQRQGAEARTARGSWAERAQSCSTASREWSSNDGLHNLRYSLHHWNCSSRVICVERRKDIVEHYLNTFPMGSIHPVRRQNTPDRFISVKS